MAKTLSELFASDMVIPVIIDCHGIDGWAVVVDKQNIEGEKKPLVNISYIGIQVKGEFKPVGKSARVLHE